MNASFKKIFLIFIISIFSIQNLYSETVYFIDFSKVLNTSKAGAEAQEKLKNKFLSENKKFTTADKDIRKKEADLISQKKILSQEDYQKKLEELRKEAVQLQSDKQSSLDAIATSRATAKADLIKALNPILKKYMEQNNIRIVIEKQSVVLGDTTLEITDQIIKLVNQEVKSIKVN